jgi:DNA-binding transcriptional LysR family regulator
MRVRRFEMALDLVAAGLGVCVLPALTALTALTGDERKGMRLYEINLESRRIVAMVPSQYLRVAPYDTFMAAMQDVGRTIQMPAVAQMSPFIHTATRHLPVAPSPRS